MPEVFLLIALVLSGMAAVLYFAPHRKILNFVNYDAANAAAAINRYAATRLLLPVSVSLGSAALVTTRPELLVPLLFPVIISILGAVVWIAAGVTRLNK
jgi:hypothetical protein